LSYLVEEEEGALRKISFKIDAQKGKKGGGEGGS